MQLSADEPQSKVRGWGIAPSHGWPSYDRPARVSVPSPATFESVNSSSLELSASSANVPAERSTEPALGSTADDATQPTAASAVRTRIVVIVVIGQAGGGGRATRSWDGLRSAMRIEIRPSTARRSALGKGAPNELERVKFIMRHVVQKHNDNVKKR